MTTTTSFHDLQNDQFSLVTEFLTDVAAKLGGSKHLCDSIKSTAVLQVDVFGFYFAGDNRARSPLHVLIY